MRYRSHLYKSLITICFFAIISFRTIAQSGHEMTGGEIGYRFLRMVAPPGSDQLTVREFEVIIKLYRDCVAVDELPPSITLGIFKYPLPTFTTAVITGIPLSSTYNLGLYKLLCDNTDIARCIEVGVYKTIIRLGPSTAEFLLMTQGFDRKASDYINVYTAYSTRPTDGLPYFNNVGYTLMSTIDGKSISSSPSFNEEDPLIFCATDNFQYNLSATDPDGDSLSYELSPIYKGPPVLTYDVNVPQQPPYTVVQYYPSFSPANPLGPNINIDPRSGILSGNTSPVIPGKYILDINVHKYRNGVRIASMVREVNIIFKNCTWPVAQIDSVYRNCKGNTIFFRNYSTGNIGSYFWDFGDPNSTADTSRLAQPTYHYSQPGVYTAKLYLNKDSTNCKDSMTATVMVDSGLVADFNLNRAPVCNVATYNFFNTSSQSSYPIDEWHWDFGEITTDADVSDLVNPSYTYLTEGDKRVRFIVHNTMGCTDTVFRSINIYRTLLHPPNDTAICYLDTIRLNALTNYSGTYSWSPNYNISSTTIGDPLVSPDVPTKYYIDFTDSSGCIAHDSVFVDVKTAVTVDITNSDTTICKGDEVFMNVVHDGLQLQWAPSEPITPAVSTQYVVTSLFGSCINTDSIFIEVVPPPNVSVNRDTLVCIGAPVYLNASGGAYYSWSPVDYLSDPNIPNPVARPLKNILYTVTVTDTLGCPKPVSRSVMITTYRALYTKINPADTLLVLGEPVQLVGSGGQYYQWSPSIYLNNPAVPDPVAIPQQDIIYKLTISNDDGCVDSDSVKIRVFNEPDIYVPTAFTPNGDGNNDVFRIYPVSFTIRYLRIFDRWGNLVYQTGDYRKGWDGSSNGKQLATGTFVWVIEGKNKKSGAAGTRKGLITLIR